MKIIRQKAQAMLEMAIFGTLIIMVLGVLLSYIQRMNEQQYILQESFRCALQKAHDAHGQKGASVNYTVFENRRNVSPFSPLKGDRGQLSATSSVYWAVPQVDAPDTGEDESQTWYRVNKDEIQLSKILKDQGKYIADMQDIIISSENKGMQANESGVSDTISVKYSPSVHQASHDSRVREKVVYDFQDKEGNTLYKLEQWIDGKEEYSRNNEGQLLHKERIWATPN